MITALATEPEAAEFVSGEMAHVMGGARADGPVVSLLLAGGTTFIKVYESLARMARPDWAWERIRFYFGDDRQVGPEHELSNFSMAYESMLSPLKRKGYPVQAVRMQGELGDAAAPLYERELHALRAMRPGLPLFDLALLGMGTDGHVASLRPGVQETSGTTELVRAVPPFHPPLVPRITLTPTALSDSGRLLLLVVGASKAERVAEVSGAHKALYPTDQIHPRQELEWVLDAEAASLIAAR